MKTSRIQIISSILALFPGIITVVKLVQNALSANPVQTTTIVTGRTAIYLLIFSLFCTPLYNIFKMSTFIRLRKTSGLFAFFYAGIHFYIFAVIDYESNLSWILPEIIQKPFLQIGLAALFLLFLLAVTSFQAIMILLGIWWKRIHNLIYLTTTIIIIHITIASKGNIFKPIIYGGLFLFAMLWRFPPLKNISIKHLPGWARDLNTFLIKPVQ